MKKVLITLSVLAFIGGLVFAATGTKLRPSGASTPSSGLYTVVFDSTDTFQVDTIFSDTVIIDPTANQFFYYIIRDTVKNIADSANDSFLVTCNLWTYDLTGIKKRMKSTTLTADYSKDTASGRFYIGGAAVPVDSLMMYGAFFETVISDSFIQGAGYDTTDVLIQFHIFQK